MQKVLFCQQALKAWFLENRRELPWRENPTPYSVWVSEVMLQQTQASVVESYFLRWMARFPTISALAGASEAEVIKLWEGLGYYSRARHLHQAAQFLAAHNHSLLPSTYEELIKIKGLGRYTVGAILSFAYKQKQPAVDGNVIRVLSRYFGITEDVQITKVKEQLWALATDLLPDKEPWLIVEGLIELGALVCKKEPRCGSCPLYSHCEAYRLGIQKQLPKKRKKTVITSLLRSVFVVMSEQALLVKKGEKGAVMADLYEFPFAEGEVATLPFLSASYVKELPSVTHHFTRFKVQLKPSFWKLDKQVDIEGFEWIDYDKIQLYPFSSGHRKILQYLQADYAHITH